MTGSSVASFLPIPFSPVSVAIFAASCASLTSGRFHHRELRPPPGTVVTSNLPFQEWTTVFASERLTRSRNAESDHMTRFSPEQHGAG